MTDTTRKAKRKLSNIDFSSEGAHIALVGKSNGGPANGAAYTLVMKATNKFSDEFIEKVQQVKVTMELPDFLSTFFGLWEDDADFLAYLMGYIEVEDPQEEMYDSYVGSKIQSLELMKSMKDSKNPFEELTKLEEEKIFKFFEDQKYLEKCLKEYTLKQQSSTKADAKVGADNDATSVAEKPAVNVVKYSKDSSGGWKPTELNKDDNEDNMSEKQTQGSKAEVDVVEKSTFDAMQVELQKALDAQKEELKKALALVEQFETEKKEAVRKARFDAVKNAVKDEEKATVLFKALGLVEAQDEFESIVKALEDITQLAEKSELFKETGVSTESEGGEVNVVKSRVAELLKAKAAK